MTKTYRTTHTQPDNHTIASPQRPASAEAAGPFPGGDPARYAALMADNPQPFVLLGPDDTVQYANPAAQETLLAAAALSDECHRHARLARAENRPRQAMLSDGITTFSVTLMPHLGSGGVLIFATDCTAWVQEQQRRREAEAQLVRAQKMEGLGAFAGGIAHDFNNLLTVILGTVDVATLHASRGDAERVQAQLRTIERSARRAAELTRQLLAFSRKDRSQWAVHDLNEVVKDFCRLVDRILGEHIDRQVRLAPQELFVYADPSALEQVLMNLVVNACDAMLDGGALTIETAPAGDDAQLIVQDTGVGMSDEVQSHLFEPFFTTKQEDKGTGLGLVVVQRIVQQHKGRVEVSSRVGEGTRFDIRLPLHSRPQHQPAPPRNALSADTRGEETILLAEDEPDVLDFTKRVLESLGYRVLPACDGEAAVQTFTEHSDRIDLIVLDAVMPRLNGPRAYARMRQLRKDVPVLFVTGYSDWMARTVYAPVEPVPVLQKPFATADLGRSVRQLLDARYLGAPAGGEGRYLAA